MRLEIWKDIKCADLFGCGSKYLAGSRERDPESHGFGIALLLSCSRCNDLYLQRRVLEYPPVMSELMMLFSLDKEQSEKLVCFLSALTQRG